MDDFVEFSDWTKIDGQAVLFDALLRHRLESHVAGHVCYCTGNTALRERTLEQILDQQPPNTPGDDETCSICFDDYVSEDTVATRLECGHIFHRSCLSDWLHEQPTCPLCRNVSREEYSECCICRAYGFAELARGDKEGAFECCGFRTHLTCYTSIYSRTRTRRCPHCQTLDPKYYKFYGIDPTKYEFELTTFGAMFMSQDNID